MLGWSAQALFTAATVESLTGDPALLRFEKPAQVRLPVTASVLAEGQIPIFQIPILMKRLERSAAVERLERLELASVF